MGVATPKKLCVVIKCTLNSNKLYNNLVIPFSKHFSCPSKPLSWVTFTGQFLCCYITTTKPGETGEDSVVAQIEAQAKAATIHYTVFHGNSIHERMEIFQIFFCRPTTVALCGGDTYKGGKLKHHALSKIISLII